MNALQKITTARAQLILDHAFFGALALRLKPQTNPADDRLTLATDGRHLFYAPDYVEKTSLEDIKAIIAEEVMHVALCHHTRRGNRDHETFNKAADFAIWPLLVDAGFRVPQSSAYDPRFAGKSAEEIYSEIYQDNDPNNDGNDPNPDAGSGKDTPGTVKDAPAGTNAAQEAQDQKVAMVQAQAAAKARGTMPGGLARMVEDIVNPKQDWKTILRDFVERSARNDYNWTRPNPRYLQSGFILPSLISDELKPLVIAIDTSGSIDQELLAEFAAECTGILETFDTTIHVLYIDSQLQHREEFRRDNLPVVFNARGGGGTDFRPAFDFANVCEGPDATAALIYFTDLEGTFPDRAPDYPVLWIAYNTSRYTPTPPFGETITV